MTSPPTVPHTLVETRTLGRWRIHLIQAGGQKLDGGAMFGIVPKPLWERRISPDDRNRIPLGMRCVLVEHESGLVLIDTGAGNKENEKFHEIYGVENAGRDGRTRLEDGLSELGVRAEDIGLVIDTHLHFDHAGGNTFVREAGAAAEPTFPRARYVVQRGEYEYATHTNERTAGSYFPHNFVPLLERGMFDLVEGEREIVSGIRVIPTPGHTPHHTSVLLESGGESALFVADLVPTASHLPLPWIMGYDVEPLVTLASKRTMLTRAVNESWLIIFEHDVKVAAERIVRDGRTFLLAPR